ncbi:hypothetical protein KAZ01_02410 [Candidatus Gracilibacteria bacterium]|nr:hypothetical protein [Candidatus Gracilibacteria bacterium]
MLSFNNTHAKGLRNPCNEDNFKESILQEKMEIYCSIEYSKKDIKNLEEKKFSKGKTKKLESLINKKYYQT